MKIIKTFVVLFVFVVLIVGAVVIDGVKFDTNDALHIFTSIVGLVCGATIYRIWAD